MTGPRQTLVGIVALVALAAFSAGCTEARPRSFAELPVTAPDYAATSSSTSGVASSSTESSTSIASATESAIESASTALTAQAKVTTTKPVGAKAVFITAADDRCQASYDRMDADYSNLTGNATDEQFTAFVRDTLLPEWTATLGQVRALTPPPGDEAKVRHLLDDLAAGYAAVGKDPLAAFHGDDPLSAVNQAMADYGFQVCGGSIDAAG